MNDNKDIKTLEEYSENSIVHVQFVVAGKNQQWVSFEDDVKLLNIRDSFDRIALALRAIFLPHSTINLCCSEGGPNKINSIKKLRELANMGLKEAKDFVEGNLILTNVDPTIAHQIAKELDEFGCTVNIAESDVLLNKSMPLTLNNLTQPPGLLDFRQLPTRKPMIGVSGVSGTPAAPVTASNPQELMRHFIESGRKP